MKLVQKKVDIIAITETWIDIANRNFRSEFEITGYQMFHKDRRRRKGGGGEKGSEIESMKTEKGDGVALYVKYSLKSLVNNSVKSNMDSESVWVDVYKGKEK